MCNIIGKTSGKCKLLVHNKNNIETFKNPYSELFFIELFIQGYICFRVHDLLYDTPVCYACEMIVNSFKMAPVLTYVNPFDSDIVTMSTGHQYSRVLCMRKDDHIFMISHC